MSFASDVRNWTIKVEGRAKAMPFALAARVQESIKVGSPATTAPGQPVQTGYLRGSWILGMGGDPTFTLNGKGSEQDPGWQARVEAPPQRISDEPVAVVATNVVYAPPIEDGVGPYGALVLRSAVGGFHSVKRTVAAANALQEQALRDLGILG